MVILASEPDYPDHISSPRNQPRNRRVHHRVAAQPESLRRLPLVRLQTSARHEASSGSSSRRELGPSVGRLANADHRRERLQQVADPTLVLSDPRTSGQQILLRKINFMNKKNSFSCRLTNHISDRIFNFMFLEFVFNKNL